MPTEIEDWNDLDNVRNDLSGDYILINDLDEDTTGYQGVGSDFDPIPFVEGETRPSGFSGTFDGNGKSISDLVIDKDDDGAVALFGATSGGASITKLSVSGSVTCINSSRNVAGLVGYHDGGNVKECVCHVDVVSDGQRIGGLVGNNNETIEDSYSTGSVTGDERVGGLVGWNSSFNSATIRRSYAVGAVTGNSETGGLVGGDGSNEIDCYWDTESTGQSTSAGSATGLTSSQMQGSEAVDNMSGFDFSDVWETVEKDD